MTTNQAASAVATPPDGTTAGPNHSRPHRAPAPREPRVRLRRAYDPAAPDDGFRVLVDRVWPRGMRRDALAIDAWWPALAPSDGLRRWFGHAADRWPEFRNRYREELAQPERRKLLRELEARSERGPVTLVFGARDRERNQAVVIAQVLADLTAQTADRTALSSQGAGRATGEDPIRTEATIVSAPDSNPLLGAVERLLVGGIGVTARALSGAPGASELTLIQWRVLVVVAGRDGVRIGDVATRLDVAVPSASRLVRRLEQRGFVATERDERDRRATLVRETAEGREVREAVVRVRDELIAQALADAGVDHVAGALEALVRVGDGLARFA